MTVPTDYIFTPGTCLKKDFYNVLCNALIGVGWKNITSNYAIDGDVFVSTGNTGDKALILNMRKTYTDGTYDMSNTLGVALSFRFPTSYTPGSSGAAGTFVRPGSWLGMPITPFNNQGWGQGGMGSLDSEYAYKIYTDKSKLMIGVEYPPASNVNPLFIYMGLPDSVYTTDSGNRGMVHGCTCWSQAGSSSIIVANTSDGMPASAAPYGLTTFTNLPTKSPNHSDKYAISEIYYGSTTEGVRGKLDGVLALLNSNIRTGMILQIGNSNYYVLQCATVIYGYNSFPSLALAIRIS